MPKLIVIYIYILLYLLDSTQIVSKINHQKFLKGCFCTVTNFRSSSSNIQDSHLRFIEDLVRLSSNPWNVQQQVLKRSGTYVLTATGIQMDVSNVNGMQATKT